MAKDAGHQPIKSIYLSITLQATRRAGIGRCFRHFAQPLRMLRNAITSLATAAKKAPPTALLMP